MPSLRKEKQLYSDTDQRLKIYNFSISLYFDRIEATLNKAIREITERYMKTGLL